MPCASIRRKRRAFTREFKGEAVRLVVEGGRSIPDVAHDLDLTEPALRQWVHQAQVDRGQGKPGELTSAEREELDARGIVCSMSRVGDCWDNAVAERFFATLKTELIHRRPWSTKHEARTAIHDYIGGFYNPNRRHSSLGYLSPMDYERQHAATTAAA